MVLSIAGVVVLCSVLAGNPAFDPPRALVKGRCVDAAGVPIVGAQVLLSSVGEPWRNDVEGTSSDPHSSHFSATSDDAGRFQFDLTVPTSSWVSLRVVPDLYHGLDGRHFGTAGGRNRDPLHAGENDLGDFLLPARGAIRGRVTDEGGAPIARAVVSLAGNDPGGYSVNTVLQSDGVYTLGHVPAGTHRFEVQADGYVRTGVSDITVATGATTEGIDFVQKRAAEIGGVVVDSGGAPIAGVRLWTWPIGSGSGAGGWSDAEGRFRIALPQTEPYRFDFTHPGYAPIHEDRSAAHAPGDLAIRLVLTALDRTSFRVVDAETGDVVKTFGMRILELQKYSTSSADDDAIPLADHVDGVLTTFAEPSRHEFQIEAPGYAAQQGIVRFDPNGVKQQTIRMIRGSTCRARITFQGEPATNAAAHLEGEGIRTFPWESAGDGRELTAFLGRRRTTSADHNGNIAFDSLVPGRYVLELRTTGSATTTRKGIVIEPTQNIDLGEIELDVGGRIHGKVVLPESHSASNLLVFLDEPFTNTTAAVDATGTFEFLDVAAGRHELRAATSWTDVRATPTSVVEVRSGQTSEVTIDFTATEVVTPSPIAFEFSITDHGIAAEGYFVSVSENHWKAVFARVDERGSAKLEVTTTTNAVVQVLSPFGMILAQRKLEAGRTSPFEFTLDTGRLIVELPSGTKIPQGGTVTFLVSPADPETPALGLTVTKGNSERIEFPTERAPTKPIDWTDTRYVLGPVPAGSFTLVVSGSVLEYRKSIEIRARQESTITLTLDDVH